MDSNKKNEINVSVLYEKFKKRSMESNGIIYNKKIAVELVEYLLDELSISQIKEEILKISELDDIFDEGVWNLFNELQQIQEKLRKSKNEFERERLARMRMRISNEIHETCMTPEERARRKEYRELEIRKARNRERRIKEILKQQGLEDTPKNRKYLEEMFENNRREMRKYQKEMFGNSRREMRKYQNGSKPEMHSDRNRREMHSDSGNIRNKSLTYRNYNNPRM